MRSVVLVLMLILMIGSCIETTTSDGINRPQTSNMIASTSESDSQEKLVQKMLSTREKKRRERNLEEAIADYENDPSSKDNIIWYGRRLAYLGRFNEAINIYNAGLLTYPNSYKILRHRGHRYITIRKFDKAIEDLQKAAFYANNMPNEIEPDGIPNAYNKPLSNIKFNIWYHLGLAYYFNGNYDKAISSLRKCTDFANNNDLRVSISNWLYATYRKLGNIEAANDVIEEISSRMFLIENRAYHDLIMLYKGFVTPEVLIERNTKSGKLDATVGYGIANWLQLEGKSEKANSLFAKIIESEQWDSFGYIATEAEQRLLDLSSSL